MDNTLKFSQNCINLIAENEGFRSEPYLDIENVPTIGYGSTFYENGTKVTMKDPAIDQTRAKQLVMHYLDNLALPCLQKSVKVNINQNMLDSLGDFIYNLGCGAFINSHLLRYINIESTPEIIKNAFLMWDKAGGETNQGLLKRRQQETELFYKPI